MALTHSIACTISEIPQCSLLPRLHHEFEQGLETDPIREITGSLPQKPRDLPCCSAQSYSQDLVLWWSRGGLAVGAGRGEEMWRGKRTLQEEGQNSSEESSGTVQRACPHCRCSPNSQVSLWAVYKPGSRAFSKAKVLTFSQRMNSKW